MSAPNRQRPSSGSEAERCCANCGTALDGPYCAACGQRDGPSDPTVRELATDAAQELLGFDGKLLATFRNLALRPGRLTVEYLAGRRAPYVGPVRVYLAASVLVFAVLTVQPPGSEPVSRDEFRVLGVAKIQVNVADSVADRLARTPNLPLGDRLVLRMRDAVRAGPERHAQMEQRVLNAIPQAFFLMVPVYAAVIWGVAPRPRRHYPAHLCYALHFHAFVFATVAAAHLARIAALTAVRGVRHGPAYGQSVRATEFIVLAAALAVYTLLAYRRVYGTTWLGTTVRVVGSTGLYFVLLAVAVSALMVGVLLVT